MGKARHFSQVPEIGAFANGSLFFHLLRKFLGFRVFAQMTFFSNDMYMIVHFTTPCHIWHNLGHLHQYRAE